MNRNKTGIFAASAFVAAMIAAVLALCAPSSAWAAQESEPNDSYRNPTAVSLGTTMYGMISKEDTDCFAFNVPENGTYKFTFTNDDWGNDGGYFGVTFQDTYHQSISGQMLLSPTSTKPESKSFELKKGTLYVQVIWSWWWGNNGEQHQYKVKLVPVINKTSITKVVAGKKSATVKFKKKLGSAGYEVRYSLKSSMKSARVKTVKASKSSVKVTKLMKNKKYYFQVRVAKNLAGKTFYSGWSAKKSVKIVR